MRSKYSPRDGWNGMRQPSTRTTFFCPVDAAVERARARTIAGRTARRRVESCSIPAREGQVLLLIVLGAPRRSVKTLYYNVGPAAIQVVGHPPVPVDHPTPTSRRPARRMMPARPRTTRSRRTAGDQARGAAPNLGSCLRARCPGGVPGPFAHRARHAGAHVCTDIVPHHPPRADHDSGRPHPGTRPRPRRRPDVPEAAAAQGMVRRRRALRAPHGRRYQ